MTRTTFDSNVWRVVVTPTVFPGESSPAEFAAIRAEIASARMIGCLSETVFTLEAVKKIDRQAFFAAYAAPLEVKETEKPDGTIAWEFNPAAGVAQPPLHSILESHLRDAIAMGFRLLHCPRILAPKPKLPQSYYLADADVTASDRAARFAECSRELESLGAGIAHVKEIGARYTNDPKRWIEGLAAAPTSESSAIAKAVAEWADADSIAAHYAYGADYFCTRDVASATGTNTALHPDQRAMLTSRFGVRFVSPEELAALL
jgi:hypothetical protein